MVNTTERRRVHAYRLRQYHEAIKVLKAQTDDQYRDAWVLAAGTDTVWRPRLQVLAELELCALTESERLLETLAA